MLTQENLQGQLILKVNDKDPKIQSKNDPSKCSSLVVDSSSSYANSCI